VLSQKVSKVSQFLGCHLSQDPFHPLIDGVRFVAEGAGCNIQSLLAVTCSHKYITSPAVGCIIQLCYFQSEDDDSICIHSDYLEAILPTTASLKYRF